MLDTKTWAIRLVFSLVLYVAAAWGWKALTDGDAAVFWTALAWLVGIRLWFALVEAIGGWIAWLMNPRGSAAKDIAAHPRENQIPPRAAPLPAASHPYIAPSARASVRRRNRAIPPGRARIAQARRAPRA